MEEYFQRMIDYKDDKNLYHPNVIDKNEDVRFIKMAYRLIWESNEFQRKNLAANYLEALREHKYKING